MSSRFPLLITRYSLSAMKRAIYPGSFDPVTNGHLDIVQRAASVFDEVIVAVAVNPGKDPLFTIEERMQMLREATAGIPNVRIDSLDGLLVRYAQDQHAAVIVKGLRALSDFEFEFEMALMNRRLDEGIETVFMNLLLPSISSSSLSNSSRVSILIASSSRGGSRLRHGYFVMKSPASGSNAPRLPSGPDL